ncbi:helix-turn-helix transcriptional regulator [Flavobacterium sp.]|jgi:proteasome accessory factor C|uniref:helix-turn-helix transcriptional regulator n=1 Tax=Flavobacterium sp. TaxID=239 RepID=UPI0037BF8B46
MFNQHKIYRVLQLITQLQNKPSKSVRFMATFLECTERTTYRYIDLLKQLGFDVQKDEHNKFFIVRENQIEEHFTGEEATFLVEMVKTVGKENLLKDSILKKIYLKSDISQQANALFKAHLSKLVEKLNNGIANNKKVVLKQYHSVNSNKISDRLVEPIQFTENYNAICAYEIESQITKYFNLERIIAVEVLDNEQEFQKLHNIEPTDVFGFTERNGEQFEVELQLSLRAYILFKEANAGLEKHMTKIENSDLYLLKVSINNPKPIISLIRGFKDELKITGSKQFIKFLKNKSYFLN